jgi:hypothetical protein
MTTFSYTALRGKRRKREVTLTWTDGVVTGTDAEAVAQVKRLAAGYDGALIGPPNGPYTTKKHLDNPYTARVLLLLVLGREARLTAGALPRQADPPAGAIH